MLISELVSKLFEIMAEHGDLDVIEPVYENVNGEWVPLWGANDIDVQVKDHPEKPGKSAVEMFLY